MPLDAHPGRNETLAQFLERRKQELLAQISAIEGQLEPKKAELAQIEKITGLIAAARGAGLADLASDTIIGVAPPASGGPSEGVVNRPLGVQPGPWPLSSPPPINERFAAMTHKELVIQALLDHFPNGGTAAGIRDFIRDAYGRVIAPSSLRPQMHRLKAGNILEHTTSTDTWNLNLRKRQLYAMYDHPTSRRAMKELQDDPPTEE
jgi:hypothetical protein